MMTVMKPERTPTAMRTANDARVPARPGLRVLSAVVLLGFALLLCFGFASPARAEHLHADGSVNLSGGYARIVLRFSDDTDADVKMANNILVVRFKRSIAVSVDRLSADAPGYIAAARRDPDGKAIRMALPQKVTIHSMMAGERLFIDLLPDSWIGPPPGLPQDVVEDLAKRAREAERKVRQLRMSLQQCRDARPQGP
jgi:hypothetical protein